MITKVKVKRSICLTPTICTELNST